MPNVPYDNFYLSNEIEDQYNSHLNLQQFCTVDDTLTGTAGMVRKIHVYKATDGTEKLAMGEGNSKTIGVHFAEREYRIQLAQNRFHYYDEEAMTDPMIVPVGTAHAGTDMFNTTNADIYKEFLKASMKVSVEKLDFAAFVDAAAKLNVHTGLDGRSVELAVNVRILVNLRGVARRRMDGEDDLAFLQRDVRVAARAGDRVAGGLVQPVGHFIQHDVDRPFHISRRNQILLGNDGRLFAGNGDVD